MTGSRATRYRKLALAEPDEAKARVLRAIADEADRGVLATADWLVKTRLYGAVPPDVE
jgi:hypothetical protein